MTLLADLARLLRHMDPMPPRVLADALAAGAMVNPTHTRETAADPGARTPATTNAPASQAGPSVERPAGGSAASGGSAADEMAAAVGVPDSVGSAAAPVVATAAAPVGDWPAIPGGRLPSPREELLVLAETVPAVRSAGRRLRIGPAGGEPLLDLEIRQLGRTQRIVGLAPANTPLTIRHEQGDHEVDVDKAGYFNVEIPAGPIRIRLSEAESGWL